MLPPVLAASSCGVVFSQQELEATFAILLLSYGESFRRITTPHLAAQRVASDPFQVYTFKFQNPTSCSAIEDGAIIVSKLRRASCLRSVITMCLDRMGYVYFVTT